MFSAPKADRRSLYITSIEENHPGFLHECYRYATSITGTDAQLDSIIEFMQEYAKLHYSSCPTCGTLSLSHFHFYTFFKFFGGKYHKPTTKPQLSDEHVKQRLDWAIKWSKFKRLPLSKKHFCFLDEKWFYTTSRRRKQRILPQHPITETPSDAHVHKKKLRSRRYATKVMFQGVITKPYPEHNFDGRISLRRVSELSKTKKESYNQRFDDSYHITNLIKDGEWRCTCAIDTKSTIQEVIDEIQYIYGLHSDIAENLAFSYYSYNKKGKKKLVRMFIDEVGNGYDELLLGHKQIVNEKGEHHLLTINDVDLSVRVPRGTQTEKDVSCDSKFMMRSVEGVGTTIRQTLHWVDEDEPIYLFMDNAGGHGTNEAKGEYEHVLLSKHKIIVVWQVPNSPETNLLDLGFWATHQAIVDRLHRLRRMHPDALARTVRESFNLVGPSTVMNIFERWELVLELIMCGEGTNEFVEARRGLSKSLVSRTVLDGYAAAYD
jgi:hypothetical protein